MSDCGWLTIAGLGAMILIGMSFGTVHSPVEMMEVCIAQPNMEYVGGDCIRRTTDG